MTTTTQPPRSTGHSTGVPAAPARNGTGTFKQRAHDKLHDAKVQRAMRNFNLAGARARAVDEVPNFEDIRVTGAAIRDRALANLDVWLERFEREATRRGTRVHWAESHADINRIVVEIARAANVRKIIKSKSMVSEESHLNDALEAEGFQVVETDLGEYIVQLARETPSHIIAPAIHKSRDDVADLFQEHHRTPRKDSAADLTMEARKFLREHFLSADMGISGSNFLIAETGSTFIVTNEGNGRMTTTLPRVHVAITGIEKVVPTLEDVSCLMRLLARSATGQTISNYISMNTGPKQAGDSDGPEEAHVIIVDAGRSRLLGSDMQEALRCIRCGACMNHCPVYQNIGGHAYGWVYPGPIGSVLTPNYIGLENALDLPNAATLCNQCGVVCPVKIPLPELMRRLREKQVERGLRPWQERVGLKAWAWAAERPAIYGWLTWVAARIGRLAGGQRRLIHRLPGNGWTQERDMPAPEGATFRELYAKRQAGRR
ncbi:MAG: iron-sulfur cluster-binding protein [Betaproteobacteria bacterium]|nr:iron-sulfur cluster-binding protein [Betaproteobacteria bacterium]